MTGPAKVRVGGKGGGIVRDGVEGKLVSDYLSFVDHFKNFSFCSE